MLAVDEAAEVFQKQDAVGKPLGQAAQEAAIDTLKALGLVTVFKLCKIRSCHV